MSESPAPHAPNPGHEPSPRAVASDPLRRALVGTWYRASRRLGRGGMGDVYEAQHVGLAQAFVVKVLQKRYVHDAHLVDRMRVEAQVLAALSHPNLVRVTDFGCTADGRPFFAMPRLLGRTLFDELEARRVLPVAEAVDIALQALAGLGAAHAAGLVHRDVKAGNIFLCDSDASGARCVKVLDFGLVKVQGETSANLRHVRPQFRTEEGGFVGTPRSAAPEQVRGDVVGPRGDLYAVGLLLFRMVAGRDPFLATSPEAMMRAHLMDRPPSLAIIAQQPVPEHVSLAVGRALAKDPRVRFATAGEFQAALRGPPACSPTAPPRPVPSPVVPKPSQRPPLLGQDVLWFLLAALATIAVGWITAVMALRFLGWAFQ